MLRSLPHCRTDSRTDRQWRGSKPQRLLALDYADMAEEKRPALFLFDLKTNTHTKT
jgi:hypothetical protein